MKKLITIIALTAFAGNAHATDFGVGGGVGTPGIFVEGKVALGDSLVVRGSYNFLDFSVDETFDGIAYTGDLNFSNLGGFVDFHPFKNGWNISGGAFLGDKSIDLTATPSSNIQIGSTTFTPAEVGTLEGGIEVGDFAPYLGLGYDNFITSKNISVNVRLGVMFTGSPEANLRSVGGTLSSNTALLNEINQEITALENDADDFKYYPVISLGIAKKF